MSSNIIFFYSVRVPATNFFFNITDKQAETSEKEVAKQRLSILTMQQLHAPLVSPST